MKKQFDLLVLGSGPGGYVAAIRASQLGMKTCIVERSELGGVCLNFGCIPTKALLKSSEVYRYIKKAKDFGFIVNDVEIDFKKIIQRSRDVAEKLSSGINFLMNKNKIEVIKGDGRFQKDRTFIAKTATDDVLIEAKNIIIATGARPTLLPNFNPEYFWDYKKAMMPKDLPSSILIIGAGAIGIEFASFYSSIGVSVTIVELYERILRNEDQEISAFAQKEFENQGIKILTSANLSKINKISDGYEVEIQSNSKKLLLKVEKIISAIGVTPNSDTFGIENTNIKLEGKYIKTNEYLETDQKNIFAIGDVVSPPWLAHKASHEGILCAEKIAGLEVKPIKKSNIPACTYSYPQIASIGLSEEAAKRDGYDINVGKFNLSGNGKAIAIGDSKGFIKTIFDKKTGEILGCHMVGPEVTEMIYGIAIAKIGELTDIDLIHSIFPHPTISESIHESVLASLGKSIHI